MFITEKIYDLDALTLMNTHMHTNFSLCARPEMVLKDMVKEAEAAGLKMIAVTDHSDPGSPIDVLGNTGKLREQLSAIDTDVRVLIGSELSAYGVGKFADSDELNAALDFRNYSCVHYHLGPWEHPEDRSPRGYAAHMLAVLRSLFEAGRADCVAHPFSPGKLKFFDEEQKKAMLDSLTDNELGDILEMGEKALCAWELHYPTFALYPDFSRRLYFIGKEAGVHFTFGTDTHSLAGISTAGCAEKMKKAFNLP